MLVVVTWAKRTADQAATKTHLVDEAALLLERERIQKADPSDREIYYMGLRPLAFWYNGFESRRLNESLSLVRILFFQVEISASV
jgi:hypothetical protein